MSAPLEMPKTGKRELQKEARRTAIIDAALEAFTQLGFNATKLDDVADRAGIGKGTIYLYFDSKENLFEEVVRHNLLPLHNAAAAHVANFTGSASDLLASHLQNFYAACVDPRIQTLMMMISREALRFPAIANFFYQEIISESHRMLRGIIKKGTDRGEFRQDANELYMQLLLAPVMASTAWNQQFQLQDPIDMDNYKKMHIDFVLRAIKA